MVHVMPSEYVAFAIWFCAGQNLRPATAINAGDHLAARTLGLRHTGKRAAQFIAELPGQPEHHSRILFKLNQRRNSDNSLANREAADRPSLLRWSSMAALVRSATPPPSCFARRSIK